MEKSLNVKFTHGRICGYIRPTAQWNIGKLSEFHDRLLFKK